MKKSTVVRIELVHAYAAVERIVDSYDFDFGRDETSARGLFNETVGRIEAESNQEEED